MPTFSDINMYPASDMTIQCQIVPPTAIGGWSLKFNLTNRFGGISGIVTCYAASGYSATSGITINNSGLGIFSASIFAPQISGINPGAYTFVTSRTDSGVGATIAEGFLLLSF